MGTHVLRHTPTTVKIMYKTAWKVKPSIKIKCKLQLFLNIAGE